MFQPFSSKMARDCAGRQIDLGILCGEVGLGEDLHRAGQVYIFLLHDHGHAGMLDVGGRVDRLALVLLVDGVLLGDGHGRHDLAGLLGDQRDLLAVLDARRPGPAVVETVIGMGQKVPSAMVNLSQTPCQSALVMKPSSGVKPPMPIMIRSPTSREEMRTWVRLLAFSCSACELGARQQQRL